MEITNRVSIGHYHASGHALGEDITWVIDQIDPEHLVPIHTEAREWFAQNFDDVILVDEEGRMNSDILPLLQEESSLKITMVSIPAMRRHVRRLRG